MTHSSPSAYNRAVFQKSILNNGIRIVTATLDHCYSVNLSVFLGAGSRYERNEDGGAFHFIEHLCFKGTPRHPTSRAVSETIERVGGYLNAATQREMTNYWVKVARPYFDVAHDLLLDMLLHSLFEPGELEKERNVVLEELASTNDHPDSRMEQLIDEVVWPDQPMGRDVGGTEESVKGISRERLLELMRRQYIPSNTVVTMVSSLAHDEVVETLAPKLESWPVAAPLPWIAAKDGQQAARLKVEYRKTDQAHVGLALPGFPSTHPDRYALDMLSIVLGEGMSSRLFAEVRDHRGLAYDIHSYTTHFQDTGALMTYAATDPKNAAQALDVTLKELAKMRDEVVPDDELQKAKELAKGRLVLRLEDPRSLGYWAGSHELLEGHVPPLEEIAAKLDAVTAADVQRVAAGVIATERLNLAVVGPFRSEQRFAKLLRV